jgi:hypothetical protein
MSDPTEAVVQGSAEMAAGTAPPTGRGHVTRHPSP